MSDEPKPQPTHQMIAVRAGVTRATVSLALRRHPSIPATTRDRIMKIAEEMGYRSNPAVAALMAHIRSGKPPQCQSTLAFCHAFPEEDFCDRSPVYRETLRGIRSRCLQLGYKLEEFWLRAPGMHPERLMKTLRTRGILGMIITQPQDLPRHMAMDLSIVASASVRTKYIDPAMHYAGPNYFNSIALAWNRLNRLGYERIGLALSEPFNRSQDRSISGGFYAMQQIQPTEKQIPIWQVADGQGADKQSAFFSFRSWFEKHQPDAILCTIPEVRDWLRLLEVEVPQRVGLVNLDWEEGLEAWTGVHQANNLVGAVAVDLVIGQFHRNERGVPSFAKTVLIDGKWMPGPTTRAESSDVGTQAAPEPVTATEHRQVAA